MPKLFSIFRFARAVSRGMPRMTVYDSWVEALETLHLANAPEDGKATFLTRIDREVAALKTRYPEALWVGVSDGAADLPTA